MVTICPDGVIPWLGSYVATGWDSGIQTPRHLDFFVGNTSLPYVLDGFAGRMSAQTGRGFQGESETSTFVVGSSENADINSLFDSFFLSPPHSASYDPLVESKLFKPVSFYVSQVSQVKAFELVLRAIGDSTAVDLSCLTQLRVSRNS